MLMLGYVYFFLNTTKTGSLVFAFRGKFDLNLKKKNPVAVKVL